MQLSTASGLDVTVPLDTAGSAEDGTDYSLMLDPVVIPAGTKHNVIRDSCPLQLTVRSYRDDVRQRLLEGIRRKAEAIAVGAGAPEPVVRISEGTPSLFNDEALAARIADVFRRELGDEHVELAEAKMGGEDFSQYGRAGVPIFMFRLGTVESARLRRFAQLDQPPPSLHSPLYYPDAEPSLITGITAMSSAALEVLGEKKQQ